jgi:hypothetical protein
MAKQKNQRPAPPDTVFQLMAEVISLREQVAQAELAAHMPGPSLVPADKEAEHREAAKAIRDGARKP